MYPNQGLTILSEVLGLQELSFGMDCHDPDYVSRYALQGLKGELYSLIGAHTAIT